MKPAVIWALFLGGVLLTAVPQVGASEIGENQVVVRPGLTITIPYYREVGERGCGCEARGMKAKAVAEPKDGFVNLVLGPGFKFEDPEGLTPCPPGTVFEMPIDEYLQMTGRSSR